MATQTTIDDLPAEMISETFSHLNFPDLVTCKLVCKRFYEIASGQRIRRLHVYYPTNEAYSPDFCNQQLFEQQINKQGFSHLQHLTTGYLVKFDLNVLNQLTELVRLEIDHISEFHRELPLSLCLPKLKELKLVVDVCCKVSIECLKLQTLNCFGWFEEYLTVKHPETIIKLRSDFSNEYLRKFKNVERLINNRDVKIFEEATLLTFHKLKEINYCGSYGNWIWGHGDFWSFVLPLLSRFMEQKKKLKKNDLEVVFSYVRLVDGKPIDDYRFEQFTEKNIERSYMLNFEQLAERFDSTVNYTKLMDFLAHDPIPNGYFDKFRRITSVTVDERLLEKGRVTDQEHLLWFLNSLKKGLKCLHLTSASVDQQFFDRLSEFGSPTLEVLVFGKLKRNFDWNFVRKFTKLRCFWIVDQASALSLKEITFLLNLKEIDKRLLNFRFNGYEMTRQEEGEYLFNRYIDSYVKLEERRMSIEQLTEFFREKLEDGSNRIAAIRS